ncbi:hypothetical protein B0H10DRAFT_2056950 [Mycena sp. CBHHK59/15]|nr:hypothetical protein B0H10DRAFT_2056950 [Mycena sp. CBHHK59/15]
MNRETGFEPEGRVAWGGMGRGEHKRPCTSAGVLRDVPIAHGCATACSIA